MVLIAVVIVVDRQQSASKKRSIVKAKIVKTGTNPCF